jgi:putative redox protein
MNEIINTNWLGNMAFESQIDEHKFVMDAEEKFGGAHQGPRPKPMVLSALAGCTGMDIISILEKKKARPDAFHISIDGELTDSYPKYYKKIHIRYEFRGKDFENNPEVRMKVERAVQLSRENYCGVSAMLKGSCEITHEIILLNS